MSKKTVVKYAYFTILLLLPYALVFLPTNGINPFMLFLAIPWVFADIDISGFETVIYCIFFMSINFFIASRLYESRKEKSIISSLGFFLWSCVIFFLFAIMLGEAIILFGLLFWGFIQFCPLYFFGILYYHRNINPVQYISNIELTGKTDRSITVEVQFPVSGANGNELTVINVGRFSGTGTTTANGAYTITGLNPAMLYIVVMKWLENGVSKTRILPVETFSIQENIDAQEHATEEIEQYIRSYFH